MMQIQVTKKHIEKGKLNDCYSCPVALALSDTFMGTRAYVDGISLVIGYGIVFQTAFSVGTPKKVNDFIEKFDEMKPVKPFSFRIRKPTKKELKKLKEEHGLYCIKEYKCCIKTV